MKSSFAQLKNAELGATAAEFAMVLPVAILFLLGTIDVGRLMWTWNKAEKATQFGARYAVVTNIIPSGLTSYSFAVSGGIPQGDLIPQSSFGGAHCELASATDSSSALSCACNTGATCPALGTPDNTATGPFARIVNRMKLIEPTIAKNNVVVEYNYSGLGYSGDPNGINVAPLVTVKLRNMAFKPMVFQAFGPDISLPDFRASLTLEDGVGVDSN
jgi:Flp pilus assembly pilin Flp